MSAVNPASLNTAPVPPPRGLGPGAVSGRENNPPSRGGGARNYSNNMSYTPELYGAPHMFPQMNNGTPYDYNEQRPSGHSQPPTPSQQAYELLSFGSMPQHAPGHPFNAGLQNYGWSNLGLPQGPSFGGGYPTNGVQYGSAMGMSGSRGAGEHTERSNGAGRPSSGIVSPISPPGSQGQYRRS